MGVIEQEGGGTLLTHTFYLTINPHSYSFFDIKLNAGAHFISRRGVGQMVYPRGPRLEKDKREADRMNARAAIY